MAAEKVTKPAEQSASEPVYKERVEKNIFYFEMSNPAKRNALSAKLLNFLEAAANKINNHDQITAMVIYSSSESAFCAGADLKERLTMTEEQARDTVNRTRRIFNQISKIRIPTFSLIDGYCFGGGLELALATDFRIATKQAKLQQPETRLAIIPG